MGWGSHPIPSDTGAAPAEATAASHSGGGPAPVGWLPAARAALRSLDLGRGQRCWESERKSVQRPGASGSSAPGQPSWGRPLPVSGVAPLTTRAPGLLQSAVSLD